MSCSLRNLLSLIRKVLDFVLDLVYPPRCFVCGKIFEFGSGKFICESCSQLLEPIDFKLLNKSCADFAQENLETQVETFADEKYLCESKCERFDFVARCKLCSRPIKTGELCSQCHDDKFFFDKNYSFFVYDEVVSNLIHTFKYKNHPAIGIGFGKLMALNIDLVQLDNKIDYIIPVPIHKIRMRKRGFNQSEILCRQISKKMSIPVRNDILKRSKNTKPQWHLNKKERENNLVDAFEIVNEKDVIGKNIILFDDIFTTGSTMNKCAQVLKSAGANYVAGVTLSITIRD